MSASITVRVPITLRKRGGRRLVVAPDGAPWSPPKARIDNTLVKALARAHRWKRMPDEGLYGSVSTTAAHKVPSPSAGERRSPGIFRTNRWIAISFFMPITLS